MGEFTTKVKRKLGVYSNRISDHYVGKSKIVLKNDYFTKMISSKADEKGWKSKYVKFVQNNSVVDSWVFYESHGGSGMLCNPLSIFKAFEKMPEFKNYIHIWVIRDEEEKERLKEEYSHHENVIFITYLSEAYAYFLARSKYLINNTSFLSVFSKREEQIYLNTWHSITVKALGYDIPDGSRLVSNMLRNLLMADYIISPNRFMTDIFNNAFRLREICPSKLLEIGYPRNDLVVNSNREEVYSKLERRGTVIDRNKKVILYAPTWNGNVAGKPNIDIGRYQKMYDHFCENIDMNEYQLLIKPHQIEYRNFPVEERNSGKYVSYTIDANELLSVVDILITDYSSIYLDYMLAKKPILFYIPDFEAYSKMRGIYFTKDELPGPCCSDLHSLSSGINNIESVINDYEGLRNKTRQWCCEYDDGHVAEKVLDIVFNNNENYNIKHALRTDKTRILIYPGTLVTNGVTSAVLSLLKSLDYSKYDVSVLVISLEQDDVNRHFDKIPAEVRTIIRTSAPKLTAREKVVYNAMRTEGIPSSSGEYAELKRIMKREFMRVLGNAQFDYMIDFSGYGTYIPAFMMLGNNCPSAKFFMWQHSDMYLDFSNEEKRMINKNRPSMEALQSCYKYADKLVSATKEIWKINKSNLATPETKNKFTYVTNQIDQERIDKLLSDDMVEISENKIRYINQISDNGISNYTEIPYNVNQIKFVTMGRCMPEKNHENIIRAIKLLVDKGHDAVVYIIGDGELKRSLLNLANELGITDRVFITDNLSNPLALMRKCDCFVFPSLYEAQGLAVLEARVLGLPIIVNNYKAVSSVLLDDKQYVLNSTSAEAIYEGMIAYINGEISNDYFFDVAKYNEVGQSDWERLLKS